MLDNLLRLPNLKGETLLYSVQQVTDRFLIDLTLLTSSAAVSRRKAFEKVKGLTRIFEVFRPVRVYSIGFSSIPFLGSFGSIPRASSEGFLDPFTPGVWRIRFLPFSLFSEYLSQGSHRALGFIAPLRKVSRIVPEVHGQVERLRRVFTLFVFSKSTILEDTHLESPKDTYDPRGSICNPLRQYQGEAVRINAMNPKPQGILVSLKPTEEGPLGKAEIPRKKYVR